MTKPQGAMLDCNWPSYCTLLRIRYRNTVLLFSKNIYGYTNLLFCGMYKSADLTYLPTVGGSNVQNTLSHSYADLARATAISACLI